MRTALLGPLSVLVLTLVPACSLERRPLSRALDAGPVDTGMPDAPAPIDAPVPSDVPPGMDVPMPIDAPILADVPAPVDAPTPLDAPVRIDAPDARPPADAGCTAGATRCEAGNVLATCMSGSFVPAPSACDLGCEPAPTAHCRRLVPTNVSEALATVSPIGDLVIDSFTTLDTTACEIAAMGISGARVAQDGAGPTVCLFYVDSLAVAPFTGGAGGYLYATGNVPLVIVSRTSVTLRGVIDVSSYTNQPDGSGGFFTSAGAGSGTGGTVGGNGGSAGTFGDGGGGGGGLCGSGGSGATGSSGATAGAAGAGSVMTLVPLRGGAAGGDGGGGNIGDGGSGGGAFQLSVMGALVIEGSILAGGAGGFGGGATASASTAGGGGGSGGGLFIEAHSIALGTAALIGAPGAGGASGSCGSTRGRDGQNGAFITGRPAGGTNPCGGAAGPGALGAGDTTITGDNAVPVGNNGPGGGGGAGCIHFRSSAGTVPAGGVVNPRASTSVVTSSTASSM